VVSADAGSALLPTLVELDTVLAQIEQTLADPASPVSVIAPEPERPPLLAADAFTNPEYLRYALKGALAVMICYLAQSAVNWPGIRTCLITCMIVGLTSEGATIQKGTLRIAGAIVGGALGFLAILVVVPNMESIASLALLVAAGAAISAWVFVGSPRISYAGVQIALAFYICVIQGFEPTWYFYTIRDRMIGILLGNAVITLVFVSVWPVRAGDAAWTGLASALRAMADLARVGGRSEDQAVVARTSERLRAVVARHFAAARQSAEEESFEWVAQEEGESNRDRFRIAEEEARAVFVMQLAVANQRPNVLPSDLPETLVAATRQFDALVAESLEASAERSQQSATRALPDLRGPLEGLTTIAHAEMARTADPEMAHQLDGRLASYREVIPRLERLGSAVLSRGLTRLAPLLLAGCMAYAPLANAPPSADRAWRGPDLQRVSTELGAERHSEVPERATIDAQKAYELDELIDLAQRTNPETRVAWEKVRQAALATGIAEATYYPKLAAAATAAIASVPLPIPETVVPGGVFRSKTQFAIPALSLEWMLLDFGRRGATVDAARALTAEANAGFNAKHQEVVFGVTREFYALTAARGKLNASQAAYDSARTLAEAVAARKERGPRHATGVSPGGGGGGEGRLRSRGRDRSRDRRAHGAARDGRHRTQHADRDRRRLAATAAARALRVGRRRRRPRARAAARPDCPARGSPGEARGGSRRARGLLAAPRGARRVRGKLRRARHRSRLLSERERVPVHGWNAIRVGSLRGLRAPQQGEPRAVTAASSRERARARTREDRSPGLEGVQRRQGGTREGARGLRAARRIGEVVVRDARVLSARPRHVPRRARFGARPGAGTGAGSGGARGGMDARRCVAVSTGDLAQP
jgi:hypothetical protein